MVDRFRRCATHGVRPVRELPRQATRRELATRSVFRIRGFHSNGPVTVALIELRLTDRAGSPSFRASFRTSSFDPTLGTAHNGYDECLDGVGAQSYDPRV